MHTAATASRRHPDRGADGGRLRGVAAVRPHPGQLHPHRRQSDAGHLVQRGACHADLHVSATVQLSSRNYLRQRAADSRAIIIIHIPDTRRRVGSMRAASRCSRPSTGPTMRSSRRRRTSTTTAIRRRCVCARCDARMPACIAVASTFSSRRHATGTSICTCWVRRVR